MISVCGVVTALLLIYTCCYSKNSRTIRKVELELHLDVCPSWPKTVPACGLRSRVFSERQGNSRIIPA